MKEREKVDLFIMFYEKSDASDLRQIYVRFLDKKPIIPELVERSLILCRCERAKRWSNRNNLLLYLAPCTSQWGKGTNRIIDEMRQNNLTEPLFQNISKNYEANLWLDKQHRGYIC